MTRSITIRSLIAAVAVALVLGIGAQAASAVTVPSSSGYPGTATYPRSVGGSVNSMTGRLGTAARVVYESPSYRNYDQYVCVTPRLWLLYNYSNGSQAWGLQSQRTDCRWIPAAYSSVQLPAAIFDNLTPMLGYSVDVVVTWKFSNGSVIGQRTYDYNAVGDYICATTRCSVGNSRVGAWVMFG